MKTANPTAVLRLAATRQRSARAPASPRRASILLLVLVVIAMLALGANTYLQLMQSEHRAVRTSVFGDRI